MPTTHKQQSLADVALMATGTMESLWDIAMANGVSITDIPLPGNNINIPAGAATDINTLQYLATNSLQLCTLDALPGGGLGYMQVGYDLLIIK